MKKVVDVRDGQEAVARLIESIKGKAKFVFLVPFILVGIFTCYFTVPADSEAVVLRFGKYARTVQPGLHFKIPYGVESQNTVPVARQLKMEFGAGTSGATNKYQWSQRGEWMAEKSMITGDKNAALVEWVVQYNIADSFQYLFRVWEPEMTLRDASESVMREVVGDRTVDEVITVGRQEIEDESLVKLQKLVDSYGLGLEIDQVQLINVNPPRPVQSSFNEVTEAQQEREKMINVARGQYNKRVPKAEGRERSEDFTSAGAEVEANQRSHW